MIPCSGTTRRGPDFGGPAVLQESPRGGEDDSVRHGPGLEPDARRRRLSGPKRQVRNSERGHSCWKRVVKSRFVAAQLVQRQRGDAAC